MRSNIDVLHLQYCESEWEHYRRKTFVSKGLKGCKELKWLLQSDKPITLHNMTLELCSINIEETRCHTKNSTIKRTEANQIHHQEKGLGNQYRMKGEICQIKMISEKIKAMLALKKTICRLVDQKLISLTRTSLLQVSIQRQTPIVRLSNKWLERFIHYAAIRQVTWKSLRRRSNSILPLSLTSTKTSQVPTSCNQ